MSIEDTLALLLERVDAVDRKVDRLSTQRQHDGGHWGSRADAAKHYNVSIDTIDRMLRDSELRGERLGVEPEEVRRDKLGRRIDRRPVRIWITGAPRTEAEIDALADKARTDAQ